MSAEDRTPTVPAVDEPHGTRSPVSSHTSEASPSDGPPDAPLQRTEPSAPHGRLLIVEPEAERPAAPFAVPPTPAWLARQRESAVVAHTAERLAAEVDALDRLHDEARAQVDELLDTLVDAPRARLQREVGKLGELLGWIAATLGDLRDGLERARSGMHTVELLPLLRDVITTPVVANALGGGRLVVPSVDTGIRCTGHPVAVARACSLAIVLVARRLGLPAGGREIVVGLERASEHAVVEIVGRGLPRAIDEAAAIAELRTIVAAHGGRITAIEPGPWSAGIALSLPAT